LNLHPLLQQLAPRQPGSAPATLVSLVEASPVADAAGADAAGAGAHGAAHTAVHVEAPSLLAHNAERDSTGAMTNVAFVAPLSASPSASEEAGVESIIPVQKATAWREVSLSTSQSPLIPADSLPRKFPGAGGETQVALEFAPVVKPPRSAVLLDLAGCVA
jgi:hypothetical protein